MIVIIVYVLWRRHSKLENLYQIHLGFFKKRNKTCFNTIYEKREITIKICFCRLKTSKNCATKKEIIIILKILPESLLACCVPYLQFDSLTAHIHNLAAKLYTYRVVGIMFDCNQINCVVCTNSNI